MKRTIEKKILLFTTLCLWLAAYGVFGQVNESPPVWTYGAEFDLNSRYVWRSLAWSEGAVWQPSVWVGISGWTFSVWSNFVLHNEPNYHQFNEFDYRISYIRRNSAISRWNRPFRYILIRTKIGLKTRPRPNWSCWRPMISGR